MKRIDEDLLYEAIKNFRLGKGYTLNDIAELAGCSPQYIHKFENGKADSLKLLLIYISLGFSIERLYHEI